MVVFVSDGSIDRRASRITHRPHRQAGIQSRTQRWGGRSLEGREHGIITATSTILPSSTLQFKLTVPPLQQAVYRWERAERDVTRPLKRRPQLGSHARFRLGGRTTEEEEAMRVRRAHLPIAADFLLSVSEKSSGVLPKYSPLCGLLVVHLLG